jgi:hypothetical protein
MKAKVTSRICTANEGKSKCLDYIPQGAGSETCDPGHSFYCMEGFSIIRIAFVIQR